MMKKTRCEIYSRVVGYIRPVEAWHEGKQTEFSDRTEFKRPEQTELKTKCGK